jgi:putative polyketide hydroxylase
MRQRAEHVPVLIVGGGPVGLSASLLLSRHGVRSLLVERHPSTSVHPKARGLNVRTMELFRNWGLEGRVRAVAEVLNQVLDVVWAPSLVGPETRRVPYGGAGERQQADSPTTSAGCAQDALEPILAEAAQAGGLGQLRFSHELTALVQHDSGVEATLVDRRTSIETTVRADWVIAADGAQSSIRSILAVGITGPGALAHRMGIYFRADLAEIGRSRPALMYFVGTGESGGVIGAVNLSDLWLYMAPLRPATGETVEDFTDARCVELVRRATGVDDLGVEILSVLPWAMAASTADRFQSGRVFLAGDAAHLIPPAGGQAMNVGIQDVHNLVWKLSAVLQGWAGAGLLGTYEVERRPVALAITTDTVRNLAAGGGNQRTEQFSNRGRVLGVSYDSAAVIPDGTDLPAVENPVIEYVPTARPGSRAPHLWLWKGDQQISALDLYDTRFILLSGPAGRRWQTAANKVSQRLRTPIDSYVVGSEGPLLDRTGEWAKLYGVEPEGAVLVRPDGHVAWRTQASAAENSLESALRSILDLTPNQAGKNPWRPESQ